MKPVLFALATMLTPCLLFAADPSPESRARAAIALAQGPPVIDAPQAPPLDVAAASSVHLWVFSASWCVPCQRLKDQLKTAYPFDPTVEVNWKEDTAAEVIHDYGIHNYPTLVLYRNGTEVARREGCPSVAELRKWIAVNKDNDPSLADAAPAYQPVVARAAGGACVCLARGQACLCGQGGPDCGSPGCYLRGQADSAAYATGHATSFGTGGPGPRTYLPPMQMFGPQSYAPMESFGGGFGGGTFCAGSS